VGGNLKHEKQTSFVIRHLIPLLERYNCQSPVLDLGCGQGGILNALARSWNGKFVGVDSNPDSIATARANADSNTDFVCADIGQVNLDCQPRTALLCDVAEHADLGIILDAAQKLISKDGIVFASFPPWTSAFGGHQQLSSNFVKWLPWAHCLFPGWAEKKSIEGVINRFDIDSVYSYRLSRRRFEKTAEERGWSVIHRQNYLIRPELLRKGLSPLKAPGRFPEWLISGCEYLLKRNQ